MSVDFRAMTPDPASAAEVAVLEQAAAAFGTDVPVVLLPIRIETRFAEVEVSDPVGGFGDVIVSLDALAERVRAIADNDYATRLTGSVKQRKAQKITLEQPLYTAVEEGLGEVDERLGTLVAALRQPPATTAPGAGVGVEARVANVRAAFATAAAALAGLRSPYQRDRLTAELEARRAATEEAFGTVERRVLPALRLLGQFRPRPAAEVARDLGVDAAGRPLRAGAVPDAARATAAPRVRVVEADGTAARAVGAARLLPLDQARLADAAEGAERIRAALADPSSLDTSSLLAAAAAIPVLPGEAKAELLGAIDAASRGRGGLDRLRAAIAAVPSGRADLDATVPDHLKGAVFALPRTVRMEHRLHVRIYPEPLAVDTHEPELTPTEAEAGRGYWTQVAAAGTDRTLLLGAWRALCAGRPTTRAAWIAEATTPRVPASTPGAVAGEAIQLAVTVLRKRLAEQGLPDGPRQPAEPRWDKLAAAVDGVQARIDGAPPLPAAIKASIAANLRAARSALERLTARDHDGAAVLDRVTGLVKILDGIDVEPEPEPVITVPPARAALWTRAPSSLVLPDRFAVVTVSGGRVTHLAAGRPVPADLKLGLDPDPTSGDAAQFHRDEDGGLAVAPSIRWMVDLDEAIAIGMAVSLPITAAEAVAGFDELFVVGLVAGAPEDGARRLESMVDAHHYTADGLELLPIGTPTNNTESRPSGYTDLDDPEGAFDPERGPSLVAAADSDGRALARALGIDAARLAHVRGADGRDTAEAGLAAEALYGGTLGHAIEELAGGVLTADSRERLRAFVTGHVRGRGTVPAFRVTDQPYGVLPVTALGLFRPDAADTLPAGVDPAESARQLRFDGVLTGVLRQMHADWSRLRAPVAHAHSPKIGQPGFDPKAHFLRMLGLQATSTASAYRFAVNVASRGGVRGRPDLSLTFGVPPADRSRTAGDPAALLGPFALLERFAGPLREAYGVPDIPVRDPINGHVAEPWRLVLDRLISARAYELRLLRGIRPLLGPVADNGTAAAIDALLAASPLDLAGQVAARPADGTPLAELLLRLSLLVELRRAAMRILFAERLANDVSFALAGSSTQFVWSTLTATVQTSAWGFLFAPINDLDGRYGVDFPPGGLPQYLVGGPMSSYVAARGLNPVAAGYPGNAAHRPALDALWAHGVAVGAFGRIPAERMTGLVREQLDVCGHRLDAWLTGLACRRLASIRAARPLGAQLGSYGWVENLRPDPPALAATGLPPELAAARRPGGRAVLRARLRPDAVAVARRHGRDPAQRVRLAVGVGVGRQRDVGEPLVEPGPDGTRPDRGRPGRERPGRAARLPARTVPARVLRASRHRGRRAGRADRAAAPGVPDGRGGRPGHRRGCGPRAVRRRRPRRRPHGTRLDRAAGHRRPPHRARDPRRRRPVRRPPVGPAAGGAARHGRAGAAGRPSRGDRRDRRRARRRRRPHHERGRAPDRARQPPTCRRGAGRDRGGEGATRARDRPLARGGAHGQPPRAAPAGPAPGRRDRAGLGRRAADAALLA